MNKIVFSILISSVCVVNILAQGLKDTYSDLRDKGIYAQKKEEYKRAIDCFDGALGCNINNREIEGLRKQLDAAMMSTFNVGKKLYDEDRYQEAIIEFDKLEGINSFVSYYLYSYIALCYYMLSNNSLAIHIYKKGIENGDAWAPYGLACLATQQHLATSIGFTLVELYEKSAQKGITQAMDSLGSRYEGSLQYKKAAEWFTKSRSEYGQYHLACFYLERRVNGFVDNQKGIPILESLADNGYAPAQYYLGLLYFTGSHGITLDKEKGWAFIEQASKQGYAPAKDRVNKKGRSVF